MYQVKFTTAYKKAYKLMKKRGLDISLLNEVVDLLRQGKQLIKMIPQGYSCGATAIMD